MTLVWSPLLLLLDWILIIYPKWQLLCQLWVLLPVFEAAVTAGSVCCTLTLHTG
jgi:hypothetical protein